VDPAEFARTIARSPDEQLDQGMRSPFRTLILNEIFARMEEHFEPRRARGLDAQLDWKILDRPEGGYDHYRVTISDGTCTVARDPGDGRPRVTFRVKPVDFLKLVTGNASGPALVVRGRLRIKGDLVLAARLQQLFQIPRAR
jgi:putative sterol carrier protein